MLWEIKTEDGWSGWTIHTDPLTSKTEAFLNAAFAHDNVLKGKAVRDVRWTCEEGHSYFLRGFKPIFKDKDGNVVETTIWKIKAGEVQAEFTGREYQIECWLCGDTYFTDADLNSNRPLHPLCTRGEHIWDVPCQACHSGEIHCGRRPFCGTIKSVKDFA